MKIKGLRRKFRQKNNGIIIRIIAGANIWYL